ncbi:hypothetical protein [Halomonas sp. B23F22_10]
MTATEFSKRRGGPTVSRDSHLDLIAFIVAWLDEYGAPVSASRTTTAT